MGNPKGETETNKPKKCRIVGLISKRYKNPIEISVFADGLDIKFTFEDFVEALVSEIGNPSLMVTEYQLKKNILKCANVVFEEFKKETARAV